MIHRTNETGHRRDCAGARSRRRRARALSITIHHTKCSLIGEKRDEILTDAHHPSVEESSAVIYPRLLERSDLNPRPEEEPFQICYWGRSFLCGFFSQSVGSTETESLTPQWRNSNVIYRPVRLKLAGCSVYMLVIFEDVIKFLQLRTETKQHLLPGPHSRREKLASLVYRQISYWLSYCLQGNFRDTSVASGQISPE